MWQIGSHLSINSSYYSKYINATTRRHGIYLHVSKWQIQLSQQERRWLDLNPKFDSIFGRNPQQELPNSHNEKEINNKKHSDSANFRV